MYVDCYWEAVVISVVPDWGRDLFLLCENTAWYNLKVGTTGTVGEEAIQIGRLVIKGLSVKRI